MVAPDTIFLVTYIWLKILTVTGPLTKTVGKRSNLRCSRCSDGTRRGCSGVYVGCILWLINIPPAEDALHMSDGVEVVLCALYVKLSFAARGDACGSGIVVDIAKADRALFTVFSACAVGVNFLCAKIILEPVVVIVYRLEGYGSMKGL